MRYLTVKTWAKEAGITRASVYKRIRNGKISFAKEVEHPVIDTVEFTPCKKWNYDPVIIKENLTPEWAK
jgi:hypothetical protein